MSASMFILKQCKQYIDPDLEGFLNILSIQSFPQTEP